MARPRKKGVDYFPHDTDASSRRTIFTLESIFGNDGYAFWFKLLETLGQQENLVYDCNNDANWMFLLAKTRINEVSATEILNTLAKIDAIDRKLWQEKIIWSQNLADRLGDVYERRKAPIPQKPSFCPRNSTGNGVSTPETPPDPEFSEHPGVKMPQSKVKESKVKESKVNKIYCPEVPPSASPPDLVREVIDYLNQVCGTRFRYTGDKTMAKIRARTADGFTLDDFKTVIDKKFYEWGNDPEMAKYLRPETLFGSKFEGYLNQPMIKKMTKSEAVMQDTMKWEPKGDYFDDG